MDSKKKYQAIVVESGNALSQIFYGFFELLGFGATSFQSTQEAVDHFDQYAPRLIVIGSSVPADKSSQFIKNIRAKNDGMYVTIVKIAPQASLDGLQLIVDAGLDSFWVEDSGQDHFELWLSTLAKGLLETLQREEIDKKISHYKDEQEDFNDQLEAAITRANDMTREAEQSYIEINQIFKTIAGGIIVVDVNCKLLRCNDNFLAMVDKTRDQAIGSKCYETFRNSLCRSTQCPLKVIKKGENRVENDIDHRLPDGTTVHYHIISTPFRGPVGELIGVVEHITDVTARVVAEQALKESERRYKELSIIDALTQLFNKRYFSEHLTKEIQRSQRHGHPLSLMLMDIDNFKHHNDTYGHADGDSVLEKLGAVIRASVRGTDVACRYGGEEFTVILPETSGENAVVVAERIRESFAAIEFKPTPDVVVHKTISIGVAEFQADDDERSFLERTDQNMYKAKNSGKNRYVYE
nr:sensor domain-containing diguanylate cyclase [Desulfobulbaceae bacterium]